MNFVTLPTRGDDFFAEHRQRMMLQAREKVGLLHGAAADRSLIATGCTSVHPYNLLTI